LTGFYTKYLKKKYYFRRAYLKTRQTRHNLTGNLLGKQRARAAISGRSDWLYVTTRFSSLRRFRCFHTLRVTESECVVDHFIYPGAVIADDIRAPALPIKPKSQGVPIRNFDIPDRFHYV